MCELLAEPWPGQCLSTVTTPASRIPRRQARTRAVTASRVARERPAQRVDVGAGNGQVGDRREVHPDAESTHPQCVVVGRTPDPGRPPATHGARRRQPVDDVAEPLHRAALLVAGHERQHRRAGRPAHRRPAGPAGAGGGCEPSSVMPPMPAAACRRAAVKVAEVDAGEHQLGGQPADRPGGGVGTGVPGGGAAGVAAAVLVASGRTVTTSTTRCPGPGVAATRASPRAAATTASRGRDGTGDHRSRVVSTDRAGARGGRIGGWTSDDPDARPCWGRWPSRRSAAHRTRRRWPRRRTPRPACWWSRVGPPPTRRPGPGWWRWSTRSAWTPSPTCGPSARPGRCPARSGGSTSLREWVQRDAVAAALDFSTGRAAAPVPHVIAGVAEPPTPEALRVLLDAVLHGVFAGDLAVALERAGAFCRVVVGRPGDPGRRRRAGRPRGGPRADQVVLVVAADRRGPRGGGRALAGPEPRLTGARPTTMVSGPPGPPGRRAAAAPGPN